MTHRDQPAEFISTSSRGFWNQVFALTGSVTLRVLPKVFVFGLIASVICAVAWFVETTYGVAIGTDPTPYGIAGVGLGLILVLRTNAGYDRWWEGRKLWGGIVNQSRNLAIAALAFGPDDREWRERFVRWVAAFSHASRASLRGEPPPPELAALVGRDAVDRLAAADHMPSFVALVLGELLHDACDGSRMNYFAFQQADRERALLIDHVGACERILKTPMPLAYSIKIRQLIALYLMMLPFGLLHATPSPLLVPFLTMLVAFPILTLDQAGIELENPFSTKSLSHLPLEEISATLQRNLEGLLEAKQTLAAPGPKWHDFDNI
jgi:putative membrane protein